MHAAAVAAVLGGLLSACGSSDPGSSDASACPGLADDCSHLVEVRGAHTAYTVRVPRMWGIASAREDDVCGSSSYRFDDLPDGWGRLVVEAVPTRCAEARSNASIGNGSHGVYRTLEDVPAPEDVATVRTAVGEATVFTQEYYECTNSCERWQEPVAIVELDDPLDPAYPTLVLRGEQDRLSRAELETILRGLAAPYPAHGG